VGLPHLPAHLRQPTGDEGGEPVQDRHADGGQPGDLPEALCRTRARITHQQRRIPPRQNPSNILSHPMHIQPCTDTRYHSLIGKQATKAQPDNRFTGEHVAEN